MAIDPKHLSQLTAAAVKRGLEKKAHDEKVARDAEERHLRAQERKAYNVIEDIPSRAEKEAHAGRNHAIVMAVKYEDFIKPTYNNLEQPSNLKDAAKIVWDYCLGANLKPTLEYWWSGDGMNSGYNIVIHWEGE